MKKKNLYYSKAIKIRFCTWNGMKYPLKNFFSVIIDWYGWVRIDDFLEEWFGNIRYLITFPFVLLLLVFGFPFLTCGIVSNNSRILCRYFKHTIYKLYYNINTTK